MQMIIIVILALAFLVVGISFIYKLVPPEIDIPTVCDIYPPTAEDPVCVKSSIELKRGQTANLNAAFFNDEDADITAANLPGVTCGNNVDGGALTFQVTSTGKDLPVGEAKDYLIVAKIAKDAARGTYPCTLKLSNTDKSFSITVK